MSTENVNTDPHHGEISRRLAAIEKRQSQTSERLRAARADLTQQRRVLEALRWEKIKADQAANRERMTELQKRLADCRALLAKLALRRQPGKLAPEPGGLV